MSEQSKESAWVAANPAIVKALAEGRAVPAFWEVDTQIHQRVLKPWPASDGRAEPLRARVVELEAALKTAEAQIKRMGEEREGFIEGQNLLLLDAITSAEDSDASATALLEALTNLRKASYEYRRLHDLKGDAAIETGRAWDILRRCEDEASDLAAQQDRQTPASE